MLRLVCQTRLTACRFARGATPGRQQKPKPEPEKPKDKQQEMTREDIEKGTNWEGRAIMDEFFSGNIREKLNDPAFQKKVVEHNDKGMEFLRNNYNKNKKSGEKDQENFKVYQFTVTPSRFIVDLFLIYLIWDHFFGEKKVATLLGSTQSNH